ncbi:MAG: hypothetical protein GX134_01515 [candidate division WS1 bacterium]|nr:hypothetical protein [candidate division WS1 bacterium]
MKWRVIVRVSYDKDKKSKLRNAVKKILKSANIGNRSTGHWRNESADPSDAADALAAALQKIAGSSDKLDHLWLYIEPVDDQGRLIAKTQSTSARKTAKASTKKQ